jgi:hypothetical protein
MTSPDLRKPRQILQERLAKPPIIDPIWGDAIPSELRAFHALRDSWHRMMRNIHPECKQNPKYRWMK